MKKQKFKQLIVIGIIVLCCNESCFAQEVQVEYRWSGGITSDCATVVAKVADSCIVRIVASKNQAFSEDLIYSDYKTAKITDHKLIQKFKLDCLAPNTQYYYKIETNNVIYDTIVGKFKTFPIEGEEASFIIAAGYGDKFVSPTNKVFTAINDISPLLFLHLGDFHYGDITENNTQLYVDRYEAAFYPVQKQLYADVPIAYMWDDHDYGDNDSDKNSPSKPAAHKVYRKMIPHYPLKDTLSNTSSIYQSFSIGRVFFILTDLRSDRDPKTTPDNASKSMLGATQKDWFKDDLLYAKDNFKLVVWVTTVPWIGTGPSNTDRWWSFSNERREISTFLFDNEITNLCIIGGDMHGVAIDDGRHNGYYLDNTDAGLFSTSDAADGWPIFHTGSLNSSKSIKGGPFSHGAYAGATQYGYVQVTDNTDSIHVVFEARDQSNGIVKNNMTSEGYPASGTEIRYAFSYPTGTKVDPTSAEQISDSIQIDSQSYPNPFKNGITINYAVPVNGLVDIRVINMNGQEVAILAQQEETKGNYTVNWNGKNENGTPMQAGVYLYRIKIGSYETIKKIVLKK